MIEQGAFTINGIQDIAATTIQKCWRGYQVREAFKDKKNLFVEHEQKLKVKKRASAAEQRSTGDLAGIRSPHSVSPRYYLLEKTKSNHVVKTRLNNFVKHVTALTIPPLLSLSFRFLI